MTEFETIRYVVVDEAIARVTLNRPDKRNAQNKRMLYELNGAFDLACQDDRVKVIVLDGEGPHFSAGHDMSDASTDGSNMSEFETVGTWGGFELDGAEGMMAIEAEIYFGLCWRWRNIPKPLIGVAHGKTIAGGLMLLWVCDIIIAADDALFSDPAPLGGANGVEYFAHPWEFGARKAKELLFTSDWFTAAEAHRLGMVNQVVPRADLEEAALAMAHKIARKSSFALKLVKESVNQTLDAQGQFTAFRAAFSIQQLAHAHCRLLYGPGAADPGGLTGNGLLKTASSASD